MADKVTLDEVKVGNDEIKSMIGTEIATQLNDLANSTSNKKYVVNSSDAVLATILNTAKTGTNTTTAHAYAVITGMSGVITLKISYKYGYDGNATYYGSITVKNHRNDDEIYSETFLHTSYETVSILVPVTDGDVLHVSWSSNSKYIATVNSIQICGTITEVAQETYAIAVS